MGDKIVVNLYEVKKQKSVSFEDYVEIDIKYIRIFKNSWVKYMTKDSFIQYSGGFLINYQEPNVSLRNIKGIVSEININDHFFYCKKDNEQYLILKELLIEKEKLEIEKANFVKEKNLFLQEKRNFFLKKNQKESGSESVSHVQ